MKQIFLAFSGVLLLSFTSLNLSAQTTSDLPGSEIILSIYPDLDIDSEEAIRLSCFAAYGWHLVEELKFDVESQPLPGSSENLAERLLTAQILPVNHEQYFTTEDGMYIVVSKIDTFDKVLGRYIINANAKKK